MSCETGRHTEVTLRGSTPASGSAVHKRWQMGWKDPVYRGQCAPRIKEALYTFSTLEEMLTTLCCHKSHQLLSSFITFYISGHIWELCRKMCTKQDILYINTIILSAQSMGLQQEIASTELRVWSYAVVVIFHSSTDAGSEDSKREQKQNLLNSPVAAHVLTRHRGAI